jgi:phosphatidate cytidylyltransferase
MGSLLIVLATGVLVLDERLAPWYPFLFVTVLGLGLAGCHELLGLLPAEGRPCGWLTYAAVAGLLTLNWIAQLAPVYWPGMPWNREAGTWLLGGLVIVLLTGFLVEMARFREPGRSVRRLSALLLVAAYLGVLPGFLSQLRWLDGPTGGDGIRRGTLALALAIFVPKMGDTGAYFTGRLLGRHPMTPVLSPKKTWEGAAGGLAAAALTALAIDRLGPVFSSALLAAGFGLTVGVAGMLGDLAESLLKRDGERKDAAATVPGFGGVLDVVDSVIFAAPVAYLWLC